jgi:deaminated glutathione amidase
MSVSRFKAAALQMVSTGNVAENLATAGRLIAQAAQAGAALAVLPEAFACYDGDQIQRIGAEESTPAGPVRSFLAAAARQHGIMLVGGTLPIIEAGETRPRAACILYGADGAELARYDKIHLFDVDVADAHQRYRESDTYAAGTRAVLVETSCGPLGLAVCYDLRFPELFRLLFQRGMQLLALPSAFTRVTGEAHWHALLRARAIENQVFVIAPDQGGRHSPRRESYGGSVILDPWGRVLASAATGEAVLCAEIDLAILDDVRSRIPLQRHQRFFVSE